MRAWIALILIAPALVAATWNVPQDAPTIQAAFDSLSDGDTVLVAAGVYHESLQAPDHSFVLLGTVDAGGDPERPVVDPSPLEGSTHLACLTLPYHQHVEIQQIIFRNGPEMYPREEPSDEGGIYNNTLDLTLRNCRFDSTYIGLHSPSISQGTLSVIGCEFVANNNLCLADYGPGRATIRNSSFSGRGDRLLWLTDSSIVENCSFDKLDFGNWIKLLGWGHVIRGCSFIPTADIPFYTVIRIENTRGCVIENNSFQNIQIFGAVVQCFSIGSGDTVRIHHNTFKHILHTIDSLQTSAGPLYLQGPNIVASENIFDSCVTWMPESFRAIHLDGTNAICQSNHFLNFGTSDPMIRVTNSPNAILRMNFFHRAGWAMDIYSGSTPVDAENNWWGDATGPYHAELNPQGLGDVITGPVDFMPWLTDSVLSAPAPPAPMPLATQLDIYPNPFNATATLRLVVNEPGIFQLDLYNLLGQHIQKIWSGQVAYEQQITFDGAQLTSGLYFVRVYQPIGNRVMALQKVVVMK